MARMFLMQMTGILLPLQEMEKLRTKWLEAYPKIASYHASVGSTLAKSKEKYLIVHSPLGRPMRANSYTEAINLPAQSTGADCTKMTLHLLYQKLPEARVVLTVHDSITLECFSEEEAHRQGKILTQCMNESWDMIKGGLKIKDLVMDNKYDVVKSLGDA